MNLKFIITSVLLFLFFSCAFTQWFNYDNSGSADNSVTDLSRLNHKPSGLHGFIRADGDRFTFEDGTPVRFWGVNVVAGAAFLEKTMADRIAPRLARQGYNLVRLHHMDAAWANPNIFGNGSSTRQLSAESMDRLDYFISKLIENGIYLYIDLLVHRVFTSQDLQGLEDPGAGAKVVGLYNRHLIDLQKEYAEQLFTHLNPYTQKRYVDEPAIVMTECINESSIFDFPWSNLPWGYMQELSQKFDTWCSENGESQPDGSISDLFQNGNSLARRFVYDLQTAYFLEMRDHIRNLGGRMLMAGSNIHGSSGQVGNLLSNAQMKFIDRHFYWDHPQGGYSPYNTFVNSSMVRDHPNGAYPPWNTMGLAQAATTQVAGMPFAVSEWNFCWPNEYAAEGPVLTAAIGALQGWDAPIQFAYTQDRNYSEARMDGVFHNMNKPHIMAANRLAALIFRRGDLPQAEEGYLIPLDTDPAGFMSAPMPDMPAFMSFTRKVSGIVVKEGIEAPAPKELTDVPGKTADKNAYASAYGLMSWDLDEGVFILNTSRTQGALGFLAGKTIRTTNVQITAENNFCQVFLTSLDDKPLPASEHILITAAARAENTGQVYNGDRTSVTNEGSGPIRMEQVNASVTFLHQGKITVHVLDHKGVRTGGTVATSQTGEGRRFEIGSEDTYWYELENLEPLSVTFRHPVNGGGKLQGLIINRNTIAQTLSFLEQPGMISISGLNGQTILQMDSENRLSPGIGFSLPNGIYLLQPVH